jgi:hypothetical protein
VELHEVLDDREAEANMVGRAVALWEDLEQVWQLIGRNPATRVPNGYDDLAGAAGHGDRHHATLAGIRDSVHEEIGHDFLQARRVRVYPHSFGRKARFEALTLGCSLRSDSLDELLDETANIEATDVQDRRPRSQAAGFEQVVDELGEPLQLPFEHDLRTVADEVVWTLVKQLECRRCGRERLAHLVGDARQHVSRRSSDDCTLRRVDGWVNDGELLRGRQHVTSGRHSSATHGS